MEVEKIEIRVVIKKNKKVTPPKQPKE